MTTFTQSKKLLTQPVYQRIEADLRERIAQGAWLTGAALPSRSSLAKEYGVGLATLERAIAPLLADGTLRAIPGQNTVVAKDNSDRRRPTTPQPESGAAGTAPFEDETTPAILGIVSLRSPTPNEVPGKVNGWLHQMSLNLERSYLQNGGIMLFSPLIPDEDGPSRSIETAVSELMEQGAMTIAIVDLSGGIVRDEIQKLPGIQARKPVVFVHISDSETGLALPHVYYDSAYLGQQAVQHLASKGFSSFAYVSPYCIQWSIDRYEQAKAMAISAGLGADAVTPMFGDLDMPLDSKRPTQAFYAAAFEFGRSLFSGVDYPRCIIAQNDVTAFGLIDASHERGLRQGLDYAIVGFDNETGALPMGLTTFRPPLEEIANEATLLLTRLCRGEDCSMQVRLRSKLIARISTMRGSIGS
ncbi:MAG: GntR family transcriptional regulator [Capsulimonadaceae bacterium]|nr:GntR family transcriptional regulator [Capsulimonadaceae bacterium]